ncbi:MAG: HAD family hydrolase [Candidatus Pacebacteria bacterium]|nr:HAD family hydrolase [Candidatus Paceibacterota bacterium]
MEFKQIIFDFDGVIYPSTVNSMERIRKNIAIAVDSNKKVPDLSLLKELWGQNMEMISENLAFALDWSEEERAMFLDIHLNDQSALDVNTEEQALIFELLLHFKSKKKDLFILTNRDQESFLRASKEIGLNLKMFELIIAGNTLKDKITQQFICKPNPLVLKPILKHKRHYQLKDFVFVGDSILHDFQLATNTNLNFIGLTTGLHDYEEWEENFKIKRNGFSYQVASSLLEIRELIK